MNSSPVVCDPLQITSTNEIFILAIILIASIGLIYILIIFNRKNRKMKKTKINEKED